MTMPRALSWHLWTHPWLGRQLQRIWVAHRWAPLSAGVSEGLSRKGVLQLLVWEPKPPPTSLVGPWPTPRVDRPAQARLTASL